MILAFIIFGVVMAISLIAQARLHTIYQKYLRIGTSSGATGAEVAQAILNAAGIRDVEIVRADGMLGDHYDPIHKRLVLSTENYIGQSIAALGVAAHECGHAIQHKSAYAPLHWRMAAVGAVTFANQIVFWLPLAGLFTGALSAFAGLAIMAAGWFVIMLFNLVTLPVEYDASRRAKVILGKMGFIRPGQEADGVSRVLDAAALTYVAAFITSLVYFLYYLMPLLTNREE